MMQNDPVLHLPDRGDCQRQDIVRLKSFMLAFYQGGKKSFTSLAPKYLKFNRRRRNMGQPQSPNSFKHSSESRTITEWKQIKEIELRTDWFPCWTCRRIKRTQWGPDSSQLESKLNWKSQKCIEITAFSISSKKITKSSMMKICSFFASPCLTGNNKQYKGFRLLFFFYMHMHTPQTNMHIQHIYIQQQLQFLPLCHRITRLHSSQLPSNQQPWFPFSTHCLVVHWCTSCNKWSVWVTYCRTGLRWQEVFSKVSHFLFEITQRKNRKLEAVFFYFHHEPSPFIKKKNTMKSLPFFLFCDVYLTSRPELEQADMISCQESGKKCIILIRNTFILHVARLLEGHVLWQWRCYLISTDNFINPPGATGWSDLLYLIKPSSEMSLTKWESGVYYSTRGIMAFWCLSIDNTASGRHSLRLGCWRIDRDWRNSYISS